MDRRIGIPALPCAFALALALTTTTQAATYTWVPTAAGTTYDWQTLANWDSGVAFPSLAGDVANLNIDILGTQTARLQADRTIGILNIGDLNGSHATTIATGTGTNTLIFDNGASNAEINVENAGTITNIISAPISLNSNLLINLIASNTNGNRQGLTLSGGLNLGNHTVTIIGGYKGIGQTGPSNSGAIIDGIQMTISGANVLVGNGTIINNSDSPVAITGDKALFIGTLVANGQAFGNDGNSGTFTLNSTSVRNAAEIIINGAHNGTIQLGGKIQIGTGSGQTPPANQRLTQNRISMNGGLLNDAGIPLQDAGPVYNYTAVWQEDSVANFNFNSAFSWVNVAGSDKTAGNRLLVTTVERGEGATAFFRATAPSVSTTSGAGQTYYSQMQATNGASLVVGSTDTSGVATRIIPWMVASTNVSNNGIGNFATYDDAQGFRVLSATEVEVNNTWTTGANAQMTNAFNSLASDYTVNSLKYTHANTVSMDLVAPVGRVITITSGGLLLAGSGSIGLPGNSDGRAGTINFDTAEGIIFTMQTNTNGIGAIITGSGGLTKGGTGTLVLTGANTYTGKTHVSGGTLRVGDGTYNSVLGDGDVRVHTGALLDIQSPNVINDSASLILDLAGLFNGKVNVADGLIEDVAALLLNGVSQGAGYYGSTAAAAAWSGTHDVIINDTYFTGNGLVHIAEIPEPATLGLFAIGGLLMTFRTRRRNA